MMVLSIMEPPSNLCALKPAWHSQDSSSERFVIHIISVVCLISGYCYLFGLINFGLDRSKLIDILKFYFLNHLSRWSNVWIVSQILKNVFRRFIVYIVRLLVRYEGSCLNKFRFRLVEIDVFKCINFSIFYRVNFNLLNNFIAELFVNIFLKFITLKN